MALSPRSLEQTLGEIQGLVQGLNDQLKDLKVEYRELRDDARKQEERSNVERGLLSQSIAGLRDKHTEFTTEVRLSIGKDTADTRKSIQDIKESVEKIADRVAKIETPFARILASYQRIILLISVCTTAGGVMLYLFGEPLKAAMLRLLTGGTH
jgi:chromosome segregation ATPase